MKRLLNKNKYYAALVVVIVLVIGIGIWHNNKKQHEEQEQIMRNRQHAANIKATNPIIGNGQIKSENHNLTDKFYSLNLKNINANIIIKIFERTSSPYITITTDSNLLEHIKTEIRNNEVAVVVEENICPAKAIICEIGVESLYRIIVNGDGNVKFDGILTGDLSENVLDIRHSGSGALELTINTGVAKFNADESYGNIVAKGQSTEAILLRAGNGGKIDLSELSSPEIHVSGTGWILAKPRKTLYTSIEEPGGFMFIRNNSTPLIIRSFTGPYRDGSFK